MIQGKHTPGAVRAAKEILRTFGMRGNWAETVAEIIDRETGAPELLEALELAAQSLYNGFEPDNQSHTYKRVQAAIHKAKFAWMCWQAAKAGESELLECLRELHAFTKGFSGRKVDKLNQRAERLLAGRERRG